MTARLLLRDSLTGRRAAGIITAFTMAITVAGGILIRLLDHQEYPTIGKEAIADTLNHEQVPTVRGGTHWRPSSVQAAIGYKRPTGRPPGIERPRIRRDPGSEPQERRA